MTERDHYATIPYGFEWGPLTVERLAHIDGRGWVLGIKCGDQEMQVYASEKGRKLRAMPVHRLPVRTVESIDALGFLDDGPPLRESEGARA